MSHKKSLESNWFVNCCKKIGRGDSALGLATLLWLAILLISFVYFSSDEITLFLRSPGFPAAERFVLNLPDTLLKVFLTCLVPLILIGLWAFNRRER